MTVETLLSADGTRIAFERHGTGAPLVLVHGTTSDRQRWQPIEAALSRHFALLAIDRRGRGASSDNAAHDLDREIGDVRTVLATAGERVLVLGHSYGAILALEAARGASNVIGLSLYEPPIPAGDTPVSTADADLIERTFAERGAEAALETFYREVVRAGEEAIASLKSGPLWQDRVAIAHTIAREIRAASSYRFDAGRFSTFAVPTQIVLGADSPPKFSAAADLLREHLPDAELAVLAGQKHHAIDTAPALFAEQIETFFRRILTRA